MNDSGWGDNVEGRLARMEQPVKLVFFTQTFGCDTCLSARQVVDQLANLSERITVEEHNLVLDKPIAERYGVNRAPAIVVSGETDLGIRYYGVPTGHELASLLEAVVLVGTRELTLKQESLAALATLSRPIDIKVFVTPT